MPGPNDNLDVSSAGLALIADFEGFSAQLYEDVAGHTTIGYGHLVHRGGITAADRSGPYGAGITRDQGLALLRQDAQQAVAAVRQAVTVPLSQNQFDALVSFTFNVGGGALAGSTLVRKLNAGDVEGAAAEFDRWNKAGGQVVNGLVRRRNAEEAMFRGGGGGGGGGGGAGGNGAGNGGRPAWYSRVLSRGSRGDDVREAQRRLGISADGIFGGDTDAAVRRFQQSKGLDVDGKIGPRTAAALG